MQETPSTYRAIVIETLVVAAACILLGLIVYGWTVINMYYHRSVFMFWGITGGLTFYTLRRLRPRDTVIFLIVLFLFQSVLLTRTSGVGNLIIAALYFSAVPAAVGVFFWSYRKHTHSVRVFDPLILGAFVAAAVGVCRAVVLTRLWLAGTETVWMQNPPALLGEMFESFLIGVGLGLGMWIVDHPGVRQALRLSKGYTVRST